MAWRHSLETLVTHAPRRDWPAGICDTFQIGVAVHSSGKLGIQLATMLHLRAVIPNLSFAADAHCHQLRTASAKAGS